MAERTTSRRGGFTLVEMLVVITIIAILAAILIPVGNIAIKSARRAANALEIADMTNAIGVYAAANGGINPPSFGEGQGNPTYYATQYSGGTWQNTLLGRYVRKAYPKCSERDIAYLFTQVADNADQSSALPFWLTSTSADPRYPFTGATKRSYMALDERRLAQLGTIAGNNMVNPPIPPLTLYAYRPRHAGESYYLYIEARHYPLHVASNLSGAQGGAVPAGSGPPASRTPDVSVRPWLRQAVVDTNSLNLRNYLNDETFQLHCAGLDARYSVDNSWLRKWPCGSTGLKFDGSQQDPNEFIDDRDNQANFSDGAMVTDARLNNRGRNQAMRTRNAFTLVELLIVISIIAIIAGMSMAALMGAAEEGRRTRARAQIAKLDQLISEKWTSYRFRQLPVRIPAGTNPVQAAQIRLNVMRELMRLEMPDRLTDIMDDPITPGGAFGLQALPAVTRAYRRKVTASAASTLSYDQAEMLYLIVSEIRDGDKSALEFFMNSEIGDVDGDGMFEILDAWGEPIMLLRWAPGHSRVTINDDVKPGQPLSAYLGAPAPIPQIAVSTFQIPAGQVAPDSFDPLKVDPRWNDPMNTYGFKPFLLRPLIVSGGPDKTIDLYIDFGTSGGGAGHYSFTNPPNDPYARDAATNIWIGTPYDANGNGTIQNGDNITNHGLELEGE